MSLRQILEDQIFVELAFHEMGSEDDPEYETVISVFTSWEGSSYDYTIAMMTARLFLSCTYTALF